MNTMTFHESYGNLPKTTLRLVKRYNVSPADFDMITDILGFMEWSDINLHIIENSPNGYYVPRCF